MGCDFNAKGDRSFKRFEVGVESTDLSASYVVRNCNPPKGRFRLLFYSCSFVNGLFREIRPKAARCKMCCLAHHRLLWQGRRQARYLSDFRIFVADGIPLGRRAEFQGGGLVRSLEGWRAVAVPHKIAALSAPITMALSRRW